MRQHDDAANPRLRRDGIDLSAIPMPVQTLGPVLELCGRQKFDVPGNILTQQALKSTVPALRTWRPCVSFSPLGTRTRPSIVYAPLHAGRSII